MPDPDQNLCNQSGFTLDGNTPAVGTGSWTRISGPNTPTITTSTTPAAVISGAVTGTYVYRWTTTTGTCSSTDDVTIVNSALPTTADVSSTVASYCFIGSDCPLWEIRQ